MMDVAQLFSRDSVTVREADESKLPPRVTRLGYVTSAISWS